MKIKLTKEEVDNLKRFCDDNLATGCVVINQQPSGVGNVTNVMVENLPETLTDITDISNW